MSQEPEVGTKPAKKARAPRPPKFDETFSSAPSPNRTKGWPIIVIDEVVGQPNFEVVGVNGKHYQIMRSVEVPVPPEVVEVLKNAIEERVLQSRGPTGLIETKRQKFSAVPWRIVGYVQ